MAPAPDHPNDLQDPGKSKQKKRLGDTYSSPCVLHDGLGIFNKHSSYYTTYYNKNKTKLTNTVT